jgi:hypothetical protein
MTAILKENAIVSGLPAPEAVMPTPIPLQTTPLDDARRMARRMLDCAKPNQESLLGYALVCSEWHLYGFHKRTGPLFDEVNALRELWWADGLASPRGTLSLESVADLLQATSPP